MSHLNSVGLSRHFPGGTVASELQSPKQKGILRKVDNEPHGSIVMSLPSLFHPPLGQFPETGYNSPWWLLEACIFLLKCAFSSFGQSLPKMNTPLDDPGSSHLLDAQQPLTLVLAAASPFFLP